jgi:HAD superfamily hydrolase (TIGR01509 family)
MNAHDPLPSRRPAPPRLPAALPRAVVFDMDGLMLDTERLDRDLWRAVTQPLGIEFPDALHAALVGRPVRDSLRNLRAHFGADFPLDELRAQIEERWLRIAADPGLPRKPGLEELLTLLEEIGIPKAVATSTARGKALHSLGVLASRFHAVICGDEVVHGKPAPDIYLLAAQRLGVAPAHCLALEDSPAGVAAARSAGMPVVMIPDTVTPQRAPEFLCESLEQVAQWVRRLRGARP